MTLINLNKQDFELKYTVNSISSIEEKSGKGLMSLISENNIGFQFVRLFVWGGIRHNRKMKNITLDNVGEWIQTEIDNKNIKFEKICELITKALEESGLISTEDDENLIEDKKK